ncbi:hypothetical protein HispidOSU_000449, partial [Sigmodon hispidus]
MKISTGGRKHGSAEDKERRGSGRRFLARGTSGPSGEKTLAQWFLDQRNCKGKSTPDIEKDSPVFMCGLLA